MNMKSLCPGRSLVQAVAWAAAGSATTAAVVGFMPVAIFGAGAAVGAMIAYKLGGEKPVEEG